ncbi:hypothetical protein [Streptomyces sp. NPDC087437]|uniref:hypothetical protein n=1 Tax=Streptomyces sp. NPDC087437 TaxID=3365789 RepID=UPI00380DDD84
MIVPFPPAPGAKLTDQVLRDLGENLRRTTTEAIRQEIDRRHHELAKQFHRANNAVFFQPHSGGGGQHLGYTGSPIIGVDYGPSNGPHTVVTWPRQYGKRAALYREFTFEGPLADLARACFLPHYAEILVRRDRTVHRLAHDLGIPVEHARADFDAVQHILETAGIADGYGQLAIPQPVRPSAPPPARLS